jgi:hypothetical protein
VKDLAYQGVEVAVCKCADKEGLYMRGPADQAGELWHPSGKKAKENWIVGMPQALKAAQEALKTEKRREEFTRWTGFWV